ncbi:MAG: dienelactone hydrolase family protein [Fibrobacteria bacterium]|nr:dienelactone hydrolase family protein [Fibrobacteria bacterium]
MTPGLILATAIAATFPSAKTGAHAPPPSHAAPQAIDTSTISDSASGSLSFLARPAGADGFRRPALVLAPEWWGLNEYAKRRARELAGEGYVVLAVDLYGQRRVATDRGEAGSLAKSFYGEPSRFRVALKRAVEQLSTRPDVDTTRLGALGFCFGGTAVLEGARAGLPFKAVASFHGSVKPFVPTTQDAVRGKILVLHGGADPNVTMDAVSAFVADAESSRTNYQIEIYSRAVHAFTNPEAGNDPTRGAAYDASAEKASFAAFHVLLEETGLRPMPNP